MLCGGIENCPTLPDSLYYWESQALGKQALLRLQVVTLLYIALDEVLLQRVPVILLLQQAGNKF